MQIPLGRTFGKISTSSFKFKVESHTQKWDYITVRHPDVGDILAQVNEITKTSKEEVASCSIIGYRNERGFLRLPRTPLATETEVFLASKELIKEVLGLQDNGLYLGYLEGQDKLKAFIDPKKIITKHLAVLAKSGAGKSYAVGVLLEELASFGIPVVVLDPHGEYSSIKYPNTNKEDKKYFEAFEIKPKGFSSQVKEYTANIQINLDAEQIKIPIPTTATELIENFPFKLTSAQKGLIYSIFQNLKEKKAHFTFEDIIAELEFSESNAKWKLISGIESLLKLGLFSYASTPASELVRQNQLTIINLKGSSKEIQETVANAIITELFEKRKVEEIPPFFLVAEEAHNFCPDRGFGEAKSSKILRAAASEGRKFGLGLAIISQRPARVDKSVLSQCTSQIALQVTNPNDLKAISSSFEGITSETEEEIKNLPIGKALVIGAADYPIFVDIRVRKSEHGGRAKTFEFSGTSSTQNPSSQRTIQNLIYMFAPKISPSEVKKIENYPVEKIQVILRPCLSVLASKNERSFHLLFDLLIPRLYKITNKLEMLPIPSKTANLSPNYRKVLETIMNLKEATASELFMKTKMSFSEVNRIVESLWKSGIVTINKNKVRPNKNAISDFSKYNFTERPKFIENPNGKKISPEINENDIVNFLKRQNIEVKNKKLTYIPFYRVKTKTSDKIIDAISYSLLLK